MGIIRARHQFGSNSQSDDDATQRVLSRWVIARIDGDDGMSYMAGSPNNVYVDNAGRGFRLGDELGFAFQYNKKQIGSVTLTDNFTTDIYVGVVTRIRRYPTRYFILSHLVAT